MDTIKLYEVETRVWFHDREEALERLPFLAFFAENSVKWETRTYGPELFQRGRLLRSSVNESKGRTHFSLGYKDTDEGTFCNIRREWDEEITGPVSDSKVLQLSAGLSWEEVFLKTGQEQENPDAMCNIQGTVSQTIHSGNVKEVLRSLGHVEFMAFHGISIYGHMDDISMKLMYCEALQYPWLLELEKNAADIPEAVRQEQELKEWIHTYHLSDRVIRKEPPTLLYEALFSKVK